jgi:phage baseplate assembly protein W
MGDGTNSTGAAGEAASNAFLGVGWAFPPQLTASGELATASYEEDVRQAIRIILGTAQGDRVMRPDFGAGLRTLLFEPLSTTTLSLAQHYVERALVEWEPRIDVLAVRANPDRGDPSSARLLIEIDYRIRSTNTFYNLVYPFYLMEGQER